MNADQCQTCGQELQVGEAVREVRRVTKVWPPEGSSPGSVSTDRLYPLSAGWEHLSCPPPKIEVTSEDHTVTAQPARVISDQRLSLPFESMYYTDPATSRQIPIVDQSVDVEVAYMVKGPRGTRETAGIYAEDEKIVAQKARTTTTYVVIGAHPDLGRVSASTSMDSPQTTTIMVIDEGIWRWFAED